ncbi:hypothetical protein M9Y10_044385 [Tritrichomonas musculus]|uniref:Myb-like DNA-binding domain containing protein n=1 Tax=Tritrichomonas musculus TaxID=1915356 RepID=A0ABR2JS54_9EUKA
MYPGLYTNHVFYHNFANSIPSNVNVVPAGTCKMTHGRRQLFSYEEDEQLKKLVEQFGDKDWKFIARKMPGRSTRQCRERYKNYLSPDIKNGPWTKEEDDLLKEKYNEYGPHWSSISKFFKSRSDVNIKNRWSALSFHMSNNNNNNNKSAFAIYSPSLYNKSKVVYQPSQNFCYQEPNYNNFYPRSIYPMMPATVCQPSMNQAINYPQYPQLQPHIVSNPSSISIKPNNITKSNSEEDEGPNEVDESEDDDVPSPPLNQQPKQQTQEIESISNDTRAINIAQNTDNSISISSSPMPGSIIVVPSPVPMSVNFSGPLPPLLQKPKSQQHIAQPSLLNSNIDTAEPNDPKRSINSPINTNSPLSVEENCSLPSLITQQDEQKVQRPPAEKEEIFNRTLQHSAQQSKEEIVNNTNSTIPISQILTPINPSNSSTQISASSSNSVTSSTNSNTPLMIHKSSNQQHNQIKQTALSAPPNSDYSLNSSFMINFPFPQSLLSNSLLPSNDQQESILASDTRIDEASINTETEVLTNTFPNFGGRLW